MKHAVGPDSMTFVDVVFPAFLFIFGIAIPLAIERRLTRGESHLRIWTHIIIRTLSLMVIGIGMGNMRIGRLGMCPIGISPELWSVLLYVSFLMIWVDTRKFEGFKAIVSTILRLSGIALLIYLAAIYREKSGGQLSWLKCRWFVLGYFGWAYLILCAAYFVFRKQTAGMIGCLVLCIFVSVGWREGAFERFELLGTLVRYVSFDGMIISSVLMTSAGVIVGMLLMSGSPAETPRKRIVWIVAFAAGMFAAGFLLRPLYGVSKQAATPSWSLYSSAICCVIYAFLYWLVDVRGKKRWSAFILPIGVNPLLLYFLSYMLHPLLALLSIGFINDYFNSGVAGIVRTMLLTVILVLLSGWLTVRRRVILRL